MSKYCPKCGQKLSDDATFCSKCGNKLNSEFTPNTANNKESKDNTKNIIIVGLAAVLICLIILGVVYAVYNDGDNPISSLVHKEDKILQISDLKLNMTGYDYKLIGNSSTNIGDSQATDLAYQVNGNGDSFTLTVITVDAAGADPSLLEGNISANGAVAKELYINDKYYWVQITGANKDHNTQEYLDSIILSKNTTKKSSSDDSSSDSSSVSSSSGSAHAMTEAECIASGKHETNHDGYCTNCHHYTNYDRSGTDGISRSQCIAQGTHDTDGDGYCKVCHTYG